MYTIDLSDQYCSDTVVLGLFPSTTSYLVIPLTHHFWGVLLMAGLPLHTICSIRVAK